MAKVVVAMSGGVDSSLAAALLVEAGHEVIGVTLHLWDDDEGHIGESLCCSQEIAESARRVCAQLGIDYYVFNYQREFRTHVIEYFLSEYARGMTPNPCMACNRELKFRALLARALALGYEYVATGHYARVRHTPGGHQLLRAADAAKDQSYMLHMLGQRELARLMFPIGEYTKAEVRELAGARGLASADRPESQDICFVPGGDYRNLLRAERPESLRPGPIVDQRGELLGTHAGLPLYTIGQRRGLGVAASQPLYVTELDPSRNALVLGPASALERSELTIDRVTFVDGAWPAAPIDCAAQIRAHAAALPARLVPGAPGSAQVILSVPQRAVTPGQSAVLYDDERVLGGGRIITTPESS